MAKLDSFLARKTEALAARRAEWDGHPEKSTMTITASAQIAGITGARPVTMGKFYLVTDSAPGLAGHALGPTSPELMLGALASCIAHTYLIEASLKNIPLDSVEIAVTGQMDYGPVVGLPSAEPARFASIAYRAKVETPADAAMLEAMHRAVEESCPVLNTLRYPVSVQRVAE